MTERVSEKRPTAPGLVAALEAHRAWLHRFALRLTRSRVDAEDLVQEAFLLALRGAEAFDQRAELRTWLYRIALNAHLERVRRAEREGRATEEHRARREPPSQPIVSAAASEAQARIGRAVARLPEMQRLCLVLRVYEELPYAEIAAIVGSSREAVKLNLVYARRKLAEWLRDG